MKITKTDVFIVGILIAVSLFFASGTDKGQKRLYLITYGDKKEIPLKNNKIKISEGISIEVTEEGARFIENTCQNQICIKESWVKNCGETAVCVPNKLAIVIECTESAYDAVSE